MKVLSIFGTRPEAIKMAPLLIELNNSKHLDSIVCVTAQHREMLDQVLKVFDIKPTIDMDLMRPNQDLFDITSKVLMESRRVIKEVNPDIVLVHGDTTTAMATSIAAFYSGVPVGHIEAGLRTHNIDAPYPEEFNRRLVSISSRWHFAPTNTSHNNLIREGICPSKIYVTGNTVIDSLLWVLNKIDSDQDLRKRINSTLDHLIRFDWKNDKFILVTGHRRENFGEGFLSICKALYELAVKFPAMNFVYPVHLNPNVMKPVYAMLSNLKNIYLIEPLEYESFSYLLRECYFVLTDSGGVQEEAPSLGKPVLVMRSNTERPEALQAGTIRLVGADQSKIIEGVSELILNKESYSIMTKLNNPYGDGTASKKIVEVLSSTICR